MQEINRQITELLGEQSRLDHLQEECAELILADGYRETLSEIADVYVLLHAVFPDLEPVYDGDDKEELAAQMIVAVSKHRRGRITTGQLRENAAHLLECISAEYNRDELQDAITRKLDRTEVALREGMLK